MPLLTEIHFWSTKNNINIKPSDYGSFKYCSKKENKDDICLNSKRLYCKRRGQSWNISNKSAKLKDKLKEFEDLLSQNKVVAFLWDVSIKLLLSKGFLVTITVDSNTHDIDNITFDKNIASKIYPEVLHSGVISGQHIVFVCSDGKIFCQGGSWKESYVIGGGRKKKVSVCKEYVAVWGGAGSEHPQPWSPLAREHHKGNLHVYWIGIKGPELLAYKRTENEPVEVIISKFNTENLIVIEQKVSQKGAVSVEVSTLQLTGNNLKRISVTLVPLQTQISCCTLSHDEKYVFLGCIDASVAILNRSRGSTRIVKSSFIPTFACWHSSGALVAISNEKGQLQYYDLALNCIKSQLNGEDCTAIGLTDLSVYFKSQIIVENLFRGPSGLVVVFEGGPVALVTHFEKALSLTSLVHQYLLAEKIETAIALLVSLDWSDEVFCILQRIIAYLTKLPLTEENARHLQNALGSFHCSPELLSPEIKRRYGTQVKILTRRYFHQLVRYGMYETAFLLAVDIGHHDLFMDLYYSAVKLGEREMAAAARAQASALLSQYSSEASCCSRSSCSQCSRSEIGSSEECSSADEMENLKENFSHSDTPAYSTNDNLLSTNFNNINPQTYINSVPQPSIDIPKVNIIPKPPFPKVPVPPTLQEPSNFQQYMAVTSPTLRPVVPPQIPLPNNITRERKLGGIDYGVSPGFLPFNRVNRTISTPSLNRLNFSPLTYQSNYNHSQNLPQRSYPLCPSLSVTDVRNPTSSVSSPQYIMTPPLPITTSASNNSSSSGSYMAQTSGFSSGKKQQAKVKFSDTVTAFIVPEVKRPVRPPPPPHLTDPQKELADSLPLCHPNEDYLKDFTPIRRGDSDDTQGNTQSKIKVVHFGVV